MIVNLTWFAAATADGGQQQVERFGAGDVASEHAEPSRGHLATVRFVNAGS